LIVARGDGYDFVWQSSGGHGYRGPLGSLRKGFAVLKCGDVDAASFVRDKLQNWAGCSAGGGIGAPVETQRGADGLGCGVADKKLGLQYGSYRERKCGIGIGKCEHGSAESPLAGCGVVAFRELGSGIVVEHFHDGGKSRVLVEKDVEGVEKACIGYGRDLHASVGTCKLLRPPLFQKCHSTWPEPRKRSSRQQSIHKAVHNFLDGHAPGLAFPDGITELP
jgi:hypothetical protein